MSSELSVAQLTGRDESLLVTVAGGHRLLAPVADAFMRLQCDAREAGFELAVASSYRSFARQLAIYNGKVSGERPVYDDAGRVVGLDALSPVQRLAAILRYSALPGCSRHHWGTDLDVFDAAALPPGYAVQLSPQEVAAGGVFDALHVWLDERMCAGHSHGFFRPYSRDRGGVASERWHLSYAPLSRDYARQLNCQVLRTCWGSLDSDMSMLLRDEVEALLPELFQRYITIDEDWCSLQA